MGFDTYCVLATCDGVENKGPGFMEFMTQWEKNKDFNE